MRKPHVVVVPVSQFKENKMTRKKDFRLFNALNKGELPIKEEIVHEPFDDLNDNTKDITRIIHSMMEELEAFGVYNQRMEGTKDKNLREILKHNRDEEIDHAMILLEKLRKIEPAFDERMEKYLFKDTDEIKD